MRTIPRILITPGEPAGIGPDILLMLAQKSWPAELVAVCDPDLLSERANLLGINIHLEQAELALEPTSHQAGTLKILPVKLRTQSLPGQLNLNNAAYVLKCLEIAIDSCLEKKAQALVTGPVQKSIINEAGIDFTGHTEFLANRCRASEVIMLFVTDSVKVALVTTHLPLSQVPQSITTDKLLSIVRLLNSELKRQFSIEQPKILVSGLNPHAGEQGHLGLEEIEIIEPALKQLLSEQIHVSGPLPADTIFTEKYLKQADVVLAMYHDQALPVVKYLGFGNAVNVTLGLPIIRTSVDHGTALDIAGTGKADPGSLEAATRLAIELGVSAMTLA